MDFADLQTFRAVVEQGGISAAARRLHRVQSSVSARMAALEQQLGVPLFKRLGRRLQLTPEGHRLYDRSTHVVGEWLALRQAMQRPAVSGVLRVGAMENTAAVRLPRPLARLRAEQPELELTLRTGTTQALLGQLHAGALDAVFVGGPVTQPDWCWTPICVEELVLISPREGPPPRTLVCFAEGCAYRAVAQAWMRSRRPALVSTVEIGSYHALIASVAAGMGLGLVPRSVLDLSDAAAVHHEPLDPVWSRQTTWLVTRDMQRPAPVEALCACVVAECQEMSE